MKSGPFTRGGLVDTCRALGYTEPDYVRSYQPPLLLISWVRWHGPYNSFDAWVKAAQGYEDNDRVRLYMALGKKRWFDFFNRPRVQYIGLNARDPYQKLHTEIKAKKNSNGKTFGAAFNEFWVGELISDWERVARSTSENEVCDAELIEVDTPYRGLTKNTEKSLIFALKPEQDERDQCSAPEFSFRIVNQICPNEKHIKRRIRRFQKIIPDYLEYYKGESEAKKFRLIIEDW